MKIFEAVSQVVGKVRKKFSEIFDGTASNRLADKFHGSASISAQMTHTEKLSGECRPFRQAL